jgi:hypothetical protein
MRRNAHGKCRNTRSTVAGSETCYICSDLLNDTGGFIAEQRWQLWRLNILAFPKDNLCPIKPDGFNFEANLARLQRLGGHVVVLKNFGAAGFVEANEPWHI